MMIQLVSKDITAGVVMYIVIWAVQRLCSHLAKDAQKNSTAWNLVIGVLRCGIHTRPNSAGIDVIYSREWGEVVLWVWSPKTAG